MEQNKPKKKGRKPQWTDAKVEIMCKAVAEGKSYKEAFTAARVSKAAFYVHLANDKDFIDRVKKAEAEFQEWFDTQLVTDCKRSLIDLIQGCTQKTTKTRTFIDKNGKEITEITVEEKELPPSATAIIFALCNRDPEHWRNRISNELSGKLETENKGSGVSLANVPDSLLAQVIDAINGK